MRIARPSLSLALGTGILCSLTLAAGGLGAGTKSEFRTEGLFVEGCTCHIPCACDMGHDMSGCQLIGALTLSSGAYKGADLSGARIAYAGVLGKWIRVYVQAKDAKQEPGLMEFAQAAFADFGKVESVTKSTIEVNGTAGHYDLKVAGGKVAELSTEPVMGLDQKTPMSYHNVLNPMSPTVLQGKVVKGSYHDGDRTFTLQGTNVYFNPDARGSGLM